MKNKFFHLLKKFNISFNYYKANSDKNKKYKSSSIVKYSISLQLNNEFNQQKLINEFDDLT